NELPVACNSNERFWPHAKYTVRKRPCRLRETVSDRRCVAITEPLRQLQQLSQVDALPLWLFYPNGDVATQTCVAVVEAQLVTAIATRPASSAARHATNRRTAPEVATRCCSSH